jgi:hypothetical protein
VFPQPARSDLNNHHARHVLTEDTPRRRRSPAETIPNPQARPPRTGRTGGSRGHMQAARGHGHHPPRGRLQARRVWPSRPVGTAAAPLPASTPRPSIPASLPACCRPASAEAGFDPTALGGDSLDALTTGMNRGVHTTLLMQLGHHRSFAVYDE